MSILFQPVSLGTLSLRNRFVRSATHDWLGEEDGSVSARETDLYRALAEGGVGLIITAHAYVQHPLGRASVRQNAIYDDRFIPAYRKAVAAIHAAGSTFVLQIAHAGRQTGLDRTEGQTPVAPSAVAIADAGFTPRAMPEAEILDTIDAFAAAAGRAKAAGCDGVQLHIAHGYLLSQFLSPHANRRTDQWGGTLENRTRILRLIIERTRRAVGPAYPLLVKLNSTDGIAAPGYLQLTDVVETAKLLEKWGVAAIEVSGGSHDAKTVMSAPGIVRPDQEAYFAEAAKAVKAAVNIPVILVGGLRTLAVMEELVASGTADLVALSRPFIQEPDLVKRLQAGQRRVGCVSCNACFNPAGLDCYLPR